MTFDIKLGEKRRSWPPGTPSCPAAPELLIGKTYFDLIYKLECDLNMKLPLDLKNKLCGWKIIYERTARWKLI